MHVAYSFQGSLVFVKSTRQYGIPATIPREFNTMLYWWSNNGIHPWLRLLPDSGYSSPIQRLIDYSVDGAHATATMRVKRDLAELLRFIDYKIATYCLVKDVAQKELK
jgi:hypothetical protein